MSSRRKFASALLGVSLAAVLVAAPYRMSPDGFSTRLLQQTAAAQDSGNGGGSGKGGNSSGNSGDSSSGNGQEGSGGETGSEGKSDDQGAKDADPQGAKGADTVQPGAGEEPSENLDRPENALADPATGEEEAIGNANIGVLHPNGMREEIRNGRYEMTDAKGRIIINRPANSSDRARLRAMVD